MYKEVFAGDLRQGDTLADGVMVIVSQGGIDGVIRALWQQRRSGHPCRPVGRMCLSPAWAFLCRRQCGILHGGPFKGSGLGKVLSRVLGEDRCVFMQLYYNYERRPKKTKSQNH